MTHNKPIKAIANGEPTYEISAIKETKSAFGKASKYLEIYVPVELGVVYGAGSLWQ